jgi:hypothetical protein
MLRGCFLKITCITGNMDEQDYPRGSYSAFVKDASSAFDDAVRPRHFFYGGDDGEAEVREVAAAAAAIADNHSVQW